MENRHSYQTLRNHILGSPFMTPSLKRVIHEFDLRDCHQALRDAKLFMRFALESSI